MKKLTRLKEGVLLIINSLLSREPYRVKLRLIVAVCVCYMVLLGLTVNLDKPLAIPGSILACLAYFLFYYVIIFFFLFRLSKTIRIVEWLILKLTSRNTLYFSFSLFVIFTLIYIFNKGLLNNDLLFAIHQSVLGVICLITIQRIHQGVWLGSLTGYKQAS